VTRVRVTWGAAVAGIVGLLGLGVGLAFRDTTPPELWLEAPAVVVAGQPFDVHVSASKPVTFRLRYGGDLVEEVAQELLVTLVAAAGRTVLQVDAVDAAGAAALVAREVDGRWAPRPALSAPDLVEAGDPVALWVEYGAPPPGVRPVAIRDVQLTIDGVPLSLRQRPEGWVALAAIPIDARAGERVALLRVSDEFGASHEVGHVITVEANPRPVELLVIPAATLALVTPAGRTEEAAAMAAALAAVPPEPRWAEPFVLPLEGRDTSGFGDPRRYGVGGNVSFHLGADIAAPTGTPVQATNDGIVRLAGFYPIKGGWVVLDHGQGVTSHYFHLSQLTVTEGDVVTRGETIGTVGSTGLSTGPHLHWEMRIDGVPTDPMAWVGTRYPRVVRP
jgi:murein DD-endopeptidase MepM/ murein hydrolase activator NlpD